MKKQFPYRYRVMALMFLLIVITFLDRNCIALVAPRIKEYFHLNNSQFGWVLGAFSLAYALFEMPTGRMGDRIGQRSVLIRIVLWWSVFTALTGVSTGLISLIFIRFFFGIGESGAFPTTTGVVSKWLPTTERSTGISILMLGINAGSAIAPLIIVPLAAAFDWRVPFYVNGVIGLAWVLVCFLWFRNEPSQMKNISSQEKMLIEENRTAGSQQEHFKWRTALKNKNLLLLGLVQFCSQWGFYFFIAWMTVYLIEGRHFSENGMKWLTFCVFVVAMVTVVFAGLASDILGRKKGLRVSRRFFGIIGLGGSGLALFIVAINTSNTMAAVALVVANAMVAINGVTNFSTCIDIGGNNAGAAAGFMNLCGQIGGLFISLIFGRLADLTHTFNAPLYLIAGIMFTGSFLWLFIDPMKKLKVTDEPVETGVIIPVLSPTGFA
ncbi:MAG: MFS transporter [Flavisolibacter sp.]